jgi:hypothetical protein
MGLDGHQAPPIPRPSDSAKTPSVPAAGFSYWVRSRNCAAWEVERTGRSRTPVFTVER